jgi:hypothetical protein
LRIRSKEVVLPTVLLVYETAYWLAKAFAIAVGGRAVGNQPFVKLKPGRKTKFLEEYGISVCEFLFFRTGPLASSL